MATLPVSSIFQSHCLSCGGIDTSKLVGATHCNYGGKITHGLRKMNVGRNLICGEVTKPAPKRSYEKQGLKVSATSGVSVIQTEKEVSTYLFRLEIGGHVRVFVEKKNNKYGVSVEVSSLPISVNEDTLVMSFGIFRSDSSSYLPLNFRSSDPNCKSETIETRFVQKSSCRLAVDLDFEANLAPFNFSFILKSDEKFSEIRSHRKTNFCVPIGFTSGYPAPLGLSISADGSVNFAFFSQNAESVVLCLYDDDPTKSKPALEIELDPYVNRSGDIWHASMENTRPFVSYGYRHKGRENVLLDPYAKVVDGLGQLCKEPVFDWGGDIRPCLPMENLVVYRLNVMHYTKDNSSKLPHDIAGTFSGIIEKLDHLKSLGVNAILLEPIFLFDEEKGPYYPYHFFSPTNLYEPSGMKEMVKRLHASGIEVFLEVVYTHTSEKGSLREIDSSYGAWDDLESRDGLNCNFPIVQNLILDSLRHWVIEFHIDGFCFINASSLLIGFHGENLSRPPLVETITFDPILSKVKLIADTWDPHGTSSKDVRFPHWKRWAEMNTIFCNDVRKYLKGEALISDLATRLCGSGDVFYSRGPAFSFNFIAKNHGLPLVDLVSFSTSEDLDLELSWNCGEEGPTNKTSVLEKRLKQIRNYLFILFISLGVPVLNMGDECGQSTGGSPSYSDRKSFNWDALKTRFGTQTIEFISFMSSLRTRRSDLLQMKNFLKEDNIEWHGIDQSIPNWEDPLSKFIAMTFKADEESDLGNLFVAFNSEDSLGNVTLPAPPLEMAWVRLVDTALPYPAFFSSDGEPLLEQMPGLVTYKIKSHSCVLFEARPLSCEILSFL